MRDDRYMTGPELKLWPSERSNVELTESHEGDYQNLINNLATDLQKDPRYHPEVTTRTGVYIWGDGETPKESVGAPRIVVNEGPPDYVNEPAPEGMPYIDLDFEDRLAEPEYYRNYKWRRNGTYLGLLGNSVRDENFREMIDFSVAATDRYFARRLHLDLTQRAINGPAYDMLVGGSHELNEMDRHDFNSTLTQVRGSFEAFVADESKEYDEREVAWRNSFLKSVLHAVKVQKIKRFIDNNYLTPLAEAGQKPAIEYTALEEATAVSRS